MILRIPSRFSNSESNQISRLGRQPSMIHRVEVSPIERLWATLPKAMFPFFGLCQYFPELVRIINDGCNSTVSAYTERSSEGSNATNK